jgi:hypothetical protein
MTREVKRGRTLLVGSTFLDFASPQVKTYAVHDIQMQILEVIWLPTNAPMQATDMKSRQHFDYTRPLLLVHPEVMGLL